jgi:hypothetical protein
MRQLAEVSVLAIIRNSGLGSATPRGIWRTLRMPDDRSVYGCVGANRPEAAPFIDEVDGVLYFTCPECRRELAELGFPLRSSAGSTNE